MIADGVFRMTLFRSSVRKVRSQYALRPPTARQTPHSTRAACLALPSPRTAGFLHAGPDGKQSHLSLKTPS
eukprot:scaffold46489_cov54-Phaeocystis_antarctica.AAC.2